MSQEPSEGPSPPRVDKLVALGLALAVLALALAVILPLWAPLVFAAWTAALLDPLAGRIARLARGHRGVGAGVVTVLVGLGFVPFGVVIASLATSVMVFVRELTESPEARGAIERLVSSDHQGEGLDLARWIDLIQAHGATAWQAAQGVAGAGAWAVLVVFVFFVALYEFLSNGRETWRWIVEHAPIKPATSQRFAGAFLETGRGLIVGAGLTSLLQAVVATILFAALGVPRAIVLGAITFIASFVPAFGTAVVWAPVALGLALKGDYARAGILAVAGLFGIGTIDNITRPLLQRWGGKLDLPVFLLLLAAFGGLAAFGPAGLALGPLALRMAREVLAIAKEQRNAS